MLRAPAITISLLSFLFLTGFQPVNSSIDGSDGWVLFKTYEGVEVYYQTVVEETSRYHHEYVEIKYLNTTDKDLTFSGKLDLWLGQTCRSCAVTAPSDYHFTLVLPAGQAKEGPQNSPGLHFRFMKNNLNDNNFQKITRFEFSQLKVSS